MEVLVQIDRLLPRVGGLLPIASEKGNGLMDKATWGMATKCMSHNGKKKILKITMAGYAASAAYKEKYLVYTGDLSNEPIAITRYSNTISKSGSSLRVFKDNDGYIYIEQGEYTAISVVPIVSGQGVNIVVMPDGTESSLTEVK